MPQLYDGIGKNYAAYRKPDPRIAAAIMTALGDAQRVVNIGAGAGSYEPKDRDLVAVEPSLTMIRQRPAGGAPGVRASAIDLPFPDSAFDAALAIFTVHHWPDQQRGLLEMRRVAHRIVILTWEAADCSSWLIGDYFPEILAAGRKIFPPAASYAQLLSGDVEIRPVPVPYDCGDGFLEAYWRRPEAYFDPGVRGAISGFAQLPDVEPGLARLKRDLESGTWMRRYGHLLNLPELDLGYRLIISTSTSP